MILAAETDTDNAESYFRGRFLGKQGIRTHQADPGSTLEEIGRRLSLTRERIRQIRERAFEKLRESPDGAALSGFWTTD